MNNKKIFNAWKVSGFLLAVAVSGAMLGNGRVVHAQYVNTSTTTSSGMVAASSSLMSVSPNILPVGTVNVPYSQTLSIETAEAGPFLWSTSGALPPGLTLTPASGTTGVPENETATLSGTPTTVGQFTFSITATNYTLAVTQTYTMNIGQNNLVTISNVVTPTETVTTTVVTTAAITSDAALQQELALLENEAVQLEAEAGAHVAVSAGSTPAVMCGATFCRDLTIGSTGSDVLALQQFLNAHGYPLASSGPGSPGNETDYFGPLTEAALAAWQSANGISPDEGYFGSETRTALKAQMAADASSTSSGTASAPMIPTSTTTSTSSY